MSDVSEKFSLSKFLTSFFQLVPWLKNIRFILGIVIIAILALTIWRAWFTPKNAQKNTDTYKMPVVALPGSHVTYTSTINDVTQQKQEEKKAWWIPGIFGELYGFTEKANEGTTRTGAGVRGGLRWDW